MLTLITEARIEIDPDLLISNPIQNIMATTNDNHKK